MLRFSNSKISEWNKKVVYAPNSFGKTTSANSLFEDFQKNGEKVDIFSRQKIAELISGFGNKFFLGKRAKLESKKANIEDKLKKNKTLTNVFSAIKASSATALKEKSFYCSYFDIKNTYTIPQLSNEFKSKSGLLRTFKLEDIQRLDQNLSLELYNKIDNFLKDIEGCKLIEHKIKASISNYEVSEEIFLSIQDIYLYCKFNKVNKCYLCGKKYKSHNALIEHIENRISELVVDKNKETKLKTLAFEVVRLRDITKDIVLNDLFNREYNTIKRQIFLITMYRNLCLCNIASWHKEILSSKLKNKNDDSSDETIASLIREKSRVENILNTNKKSKKQIETYNNYIMKEIEKFLILNESIIIEPLNDTCGLTFKIDGRIINPYEALSESEIKRLSLIVLKAEVRYQHIKTFILDDPIDSYDDYNKRIACQYIRELVSRKSLKNWYIFTNDFECVYYLSKSLRANTIFYLHGIDSIFNGVSSDIEVECNHKKVDIIAKNDLYFLDYFVNRNQNNFEFDQDILFCALTLTLRNVKTDFLNKFKNIQISNGPFSSKNDWSNHVKTYIEGYTEHYDVTNSALVTIGEVSLPFYSLSTNHRASLPAFLISNNNHYESFRENTAKSLLPINNTYVDVVNYLFKKVVIVNYLKYELEKKLMLLVQINFSKPDFDAVESKKTGLYNRILEAIRINKLNGYGLDKKLNKINSIHSQFSSLYNAIDHGTTLMISPYLSTSVRDIENFKNEIAKI